MKTTTTTTTTKTTTMGLGDKDDNDDNGTRQRGAMRDANTPSFLVSFFSVSFLFSLLTSYFLFYSYNINDNMPPWQVAVDGPRETDNRPGVTDDTPFIWGL
jgi:hypothetical protein